MRPTLYAFATAQLDGLLAQNELDLAGLLEPFQVTNVRVTDTAHQSHLITALPLHIVEARTQPRPESTEHFIDSLDSLVHRAAAGDIPPPLQVAAPTRAADAGNEGWKGRPVESITPWFAVMRDHVLHKRDLVEYETFACPVACTCALRIVQLLTVRLQACSQSRPPTPIRCPPSQIYGIARPRTTCSRLHRR